MAIGPEVTYSNVYSNSVTQHNTTQHNTTEHNTTQHNTTQHNTAQHNTTQHNTQHTTHNTRHDTHTHTHIAVYYVTSSDFVNKPSSDPVLYQDHQIKVSLHIELRIRSLYTS